MFQPGRTISNAEIADLLATTRDNGNGTNTVICVTVAARDSTLAGDPELRALVAGAFVGPEPPASGSNHESDGSDAAHGDHNDVSLVSQGSHVRIPDSELADMLPPSSVPWTAYGMSACQGHWDPQCFEAWPPANDAWLLLISAGNDRPGLPLHPTLPDALCTYTAPNTAYLLVYFGREPVVYSLAAMEYVVYATAPPPQRPHPSPGAGVRPRAAGALDCRQGGTRAPLCPLLDG